MPVRKFEISHRIWRPLLRACKLILAVMAGLSWPIFITPYGHTAPRIIESFLVPKFHQTARCPGVASHYGDRNNLLGKRRGTFGVGRGKHGGIDILVPVGTKVHAVASGHVFAVLKQRVGGMLVRIAHPSIKAENEYKLYSSYAHLSKIVVRYGQSVQVGQVIGLSGKTGQTRIPHLHLNTRFSSNDQTFEEARFVDPLRALSSNQDGPNSGSVLIAHIDRNGKISPRSAKFVWPIACRTEN